MAGPLKRGNWSTHELERLRALYPRSTKEHVARLLRRSVNSVERKAEELFARPVRARSWTAEDDLRLREGYGVVDLRSMSLVLSRPLADVRARVDALRDRQRPGAPWTRSATGMLKRLYGSRDDADLVVCFSRPIGEIQAKAAELCLSKDKAFLARNSDGRRPMPRWSDEDVHLLLRLYPRTGNLELAKRLDRSVASVANKANQLGLSKDAEILQEMGRRNVAIRYGRDGDTG